MPPETKQALYNGDLDLEVWTAIPGHPRFEISTEARVRDHRSKRLVKPDKGHRYPRVTFGGHREYLHQLMMRSWVGPRPAGQQVLHGDDDPLNCQIGNLSYGTPKDNGADRIRNRGNAS